MLQLDSDELTWFSIKVDPNNDGLIKSCGDCEKTHCEREILVKYLFLFNKALMFLS